MSDDQEAAAMAAADPALLAATGVKKAYRGRGLRAQQAVVALNGVTIALEPAQTTAVVGESGCGKSTLARLLVGLDEPDEGDVCFRGRPLARLDKRGEVEYRRAVQMLFQHPQQALNPMLSVGASVRDALRLRDDLPRGQRHDRASELMSLVGLDPALMPRKRGELSGGELQRVALARALASDPELLILDEPTSALDASVRGQVVELLLRLQAEAGLGYLLITHDMRLVKMMASRVAIMYLGDVVEEGTVGDVLTTPLHPYTRSLIDAATLDPDGKERSVIRGEVFEISADYVGCRFVSRCNFAKERCQEPQQRREVREGQYARCWRAGQI